MAFDPVRATPMYQQCIKKIEDVRKNPGQSGITTCLNLPEDEYCQLWRMVGVHRLRTSSKFKTTFAVLALDESVERATAITLTSPDSFERCIKKIRDVQNTPGCETIITCSNLTHYERGQIWGMSGVQALHSDTIVDATFAILPQ